MGTPPAAGKGDALDAHQPRSALNAREVFGPLDAAQPRSALDVRKEPRAAGRGPEKARMRSRIRTGSGAPGPPKVRAEQASVAIGHFNVGTHSRKAGHTVAAALAYRCAGTVHCPRTGETKDYSRRGGSVAEWGIISAVDTPLTASLDTLADGIEEAEKRRDSQIGRDFQFALPHELARDAQIELTREFAAKITQRYHSIGAWAVHAPHEGGDGDARNVHAHFFMATRALTNEGTLGRKLTELSNRREASNEITELRKLWEETAITKLAAAGLAARVDVGRRDDGDPAPKLGSECTAIERKALHERGQSSAGLNVAQVVTGGGARTRRGRNLGSHGSRRRRRRRATIRKVLTPPVIAERTPEPMPGTTHATPPLALDAPAPTQAISATLHGDDRLEWLDRTLHASESHEAIVRAASTPTRALAVAAPGTLAHVDAGPDDAAHPITTRRVTPTREANEELLERLERGLAEVNAMYAILKATSTPAQARAAEVPALAENPREDPFERFGRDLVALENHEAIVRAASTPTRVPAIAAPGPVTQADAGPHNAARPLTPDAGARGHELGEAIRASFDREHAAFETERAIRNAASTPTRALAIAAPGALDQVDTDPHDAARPLATDAPARGHELGEAIRAWFDRERAAFETERAIRNAVSTPTRALAIAAPGALAHVDAGPDAPAPTCAITVERPVPAATPDVTASARIMQALTRPASTALVPTVRAYRRAREAFASDEALTEALTERTQHPATPSIARERRTGAHPRHGAPVTGGHVHGIGIGDTLAQWFGFQRVGKDSADDLIEDALALLLSLLRTKTPAYTPPAAKPAQAGTTHAQERKARQAAIDARHRPTTKAPAPQHRAPDRGEPEQPGTTQARAANTRQADAHAPQRADTEAPAPKRPAPDPLTVTINAIAARYLGLAQDHSWQRARGDGTAKERIAEALADPKIGVPSAARPTVAEHIVRTLEAFATDRYGYDENNGRAHGMPSPFDREFAEDFAEAAGLHSFPREYDARLEAWEAWRQETGTLWQERYVPALLGMCRATIERARQASTIAPAPTRTRAPTRAPVRTPPARGGPGKR